jgi:hypothetical protein
MCLNEKGLREYFYESYQEAQSSVGRAVNGPANRIDRLRLLGNGVVPQCAEKAFIELWKAHESP